MIHLAHHDGTGLRAAEYEGVDRLPESGWIWLDLETEDVDEVFELGTALGFDPLSIEDVVTDMLPKLDTLDEYRYLVCHGIRERERRIETLEFDMFLSPRMLVTFRPAEVDSVTWVRERLGTSMLSGISSPAELTARILEVGSRSYPHLIDILEARIEDLEDRAMLADNSVIGEAQALRRDVILLRRVFGPQRDVLQRLSWDDEFTHAARRAFADVYDHHFRFVESLDSSRALIGSIQETHRGAIAARTNEVMKVLTVFSAIVLPLTLVAGIWGMNVELPLAGRADAFTWIVGGMATASVVLWLYFARRGFVGGIRLSRLPRAVGLTFGHRSPGTEDQVKP